MKKLVVSDILNETTPALLSTALLLARCTVGILLFMAGAGKVLGWFGGYGLTLTIQGYSKMGFSAPLAYLSSFTEFIGGFLLVVGMWTRPAAFAVLINMIVATIVSLPRGFMGPSGAQTPFMFLMVDLIILIAGPLSYSFDKLFSRKLKLSE